MEDQNESKQSGIGIYPGFFQTSIAKGENRNFEIHVINYYDIPLTIEVGSAEFVQNSSNLQNSINRTDRFSTWILSKNSLVGANSEIVLPVSLTIPDNETVNEGSYYPAVILLFTTQDQSAQTNIQFEQAVPLYVKMTETSVVSVEVTAFNGSSYAIGNDPDFTVSIQNTGNTFVSPSGYIEFEKLNFFDTSDKTRMGTEAFNTKQTLVLPGSTLHEQIDWKQRTFGRYQGTLYLATQDQNQYIDSLDFWVIPSMYLYIAGFAILLCLSIMVIWLTKFRKRRIRNGVRQSRFAHKLNSLLHHHG